MSSSACKCVFYRREHNAKGNPMELSFKGLEIQKWNIPTDRAQRVDKKNGVTCLIIMFTPGVTVIKMSKIVHFLYFQLVTAKFSHNLSKNLKKNYAHFLWVGFNCLKATVPLRGDSLLFTTKILGGSDTHLSDFRRMKGWFHLEVIQWFEPGTTGKVIQRPC